ncbi:hypothetical protein IMG5_112590 [Ichthyophthirius multifiliis]|uniref:Uncharacterized protein n=1 Tax=Ichthyophthirius multifiliis TaxID=5932 RepID=G0QTX3_ICHMU|nr:hypothetical protein IMG5_112590 [Ichthyophthirius multifiliis]EGR31332.1 hypothetical protein IMG5_112590 [Ichthyophthirius multifiliis]|eukprot:XP_004034818.1 hypothetical protein IMG5_112590 [Ichthyophthirius multifiliis]
MYLNNNNVKEIKYDIFQIKESIFQGFSNEQKANLGLSLSNQLFGMLNQENIKEDEDVEDYFCVLEFILKLFETFNKSYDLKINNILFNVANKVLNISLMLILIKREISIKLLIEKKVIFICKYICQINENFRQTLSLQIFSIIYEVLNHKDLYLYTLEFSIKYFLIKQRFLLYHNIDISQFQQDFKNLCSKGPKDVVKVFKKICIIERRNKKKLECKLKPDYQRKFHYIYQFTEQEKCLFNQLYEICSKNEQKKEFLQDYDELNWENINTKVMNKYVFGQIMQNLFIYYPCLSEIMTQEKKYRKIFVDFMLKDSLGNCKQFIVQFFVSVYIQKHNLDLLEKYWEKYMRKSEKIVEKIFIKIEKYEKLMLYLQVLECLFESGSYFRFFEKKNNENMKEFLEKILMKMLFLGKKDENLFSFLNLPQIYAVLYNNYINQILKNVFKQNQKDAYQIYIFGREIKQLFYSQNADFSHFFDVLNFIFQNENHNCIDYSQKNKKETFQEQTPIINQQDFEFLQEDNLQQNEQKKQQNSQKKTERKMNTQMSFKEKEKQKDPYFKQTIHNRVNQDSFNKQKQAVKHIQKWQLNKYSIKISKKSMFMKLKNQMLIIEINGKIRIHNLLQIRQIQVDFQSIYIVKLFMRNSFYIRNCLKYLFWYRIWKILKIAKLIVHLKNKKRKFLQLKREVKKNRIQIRKEKKKKILVFKKKKVQKKQRKIVKNFQIQKKTNKQQIQLKIRKIRRF